MSKEIDLQILRSKRQLKESDFVKRSVLIRREYTDIIDIHSDSGITIYIDNAITSYFNFDLTLYRITNKVSKKFYLSFYKEGSVEDLAWHYVNTMGSGTIGDAIRKEGVHNFKFDILGKFNDFEVMKFTMLAMQKSLSKKYDSYPTSSSVDYSLNS